MRGLHEEVQHSYDSAGRGWVHDKERSPMLGLRDKPAARHAHQQRPTLHREFYLTTGLRVM